MKCKWRIDAYDFAILDLETYLDTHPNDSRAIQLRELYRAKREELVHEYEMRFGPYVVTRRDIHDPTCWTWVNDPWPWDLKED